MAGHEIDDMKGKGEGAQVYEKVCEEVYEIRVEGHLDEVWAEWFEGLSLAHEPEGASTLSGPVADQAALHSLLGRVRDLGLVLLSVRLLDYRRRAAPACDSPREEEVRK